MYKVRLSGNLDVNELEKKFDQLLERISKKTLQIAKAQTPVRTGRARSGWTESSSDDGFFVQNNVPYIEQLEKGRSRQAPKGITKPTVRKVTGFIKKRRITR